MCSSSSMLTLLLWTTNQQPCCIYCMHFFLLFFSILVEDGWMGPPSQPPPTTETNFRSFNMFLPIWNLAKFDENRMFHYVKWCNISISKYFQVSHSWNTFGGFFGAKFEHLWVCIFVEHSSAISYTLRETSLTYIKQNFVQKNFATIRFAILSRSTLKKGDSPFLSVMPSIP